MFVDIDLRQQSDQFWRLMYIYPVFTSASDNLLGNQSLAFGDHTGRSIGLTIGEGDCLAR